MITIFVFLMLALVCLVGSLRRFNFNGHIIK